MEKFAAPKDVFQKANESVQFVCSPYLKTRVLAELQSRIQSHRKQRLLALFGYAGFAMSLVLGLTFYLAQPPTFKFGVGQDVAIQIDLKSLQNLPIAQAEIELPSGVNFHLDSIPDLASRRNLVLDWAKLAAVARNQEFPFIVRGTETGTKQVLVKFFDRNHMLIDQRKIQVKFVAAG